MSSFKNFQTAIGLLIPGLLLLLVGTLKAQEPVRSAALPPLTVYRRPPEPPETFFHLGPFQELLIGTLSTAYTDNVNLTQTDKISNLSFSLGMNLSSTWVLSHLNQLTLTFGGALTENLYGNGRSQFTVSVDPHSLLEFRFSISEVEFRFYDSFSYTQNPTTSPTATNTANLNSLSNTVGLIAAKDLGIALLSLGGDYTYNNQNGQNSNGANNSATTGSRQTFRVTPALTFPLTPEILYGINGTATRSSGLHNPNVNSLNFGPFIGGKLGRKLEFDLAAGATLVSTKPSIDPTYYFSGALRYQLDRHIQILLSGSHQLIFTTGTELTEQNLVKLGGKLDLTRTVSINLSPFINFGNVETTNNNSGVSTGPYTLWGVEVGVTWKPRRRWSTELTYNYVRRTSGSSGASNATSDSYLQNTVSLSISYAF